MNPAEAGWGPDGSEEFTVTLAPGSYYVLVTAPAGAISQSAPVPTYNLDMRFRPFAYEYSAKIVCGTQTEPSDLRLARGLYATTVNIHNPGSIPALVFKKLALAYPPRGTGPGPDRRARRAYAWLRFCREDRLQCVRERAFRGSSRSATRVVRMESSSVVLP